MSERASTAKGSYGFAFYRHDGSTFQEVFNLRMPPLSDIDNDEEEVTSHNSPNRKKEFIRTLGEDAPSELEIDYDNDDATHRALFRDAFSSDDDSNGLYKMEFPDLDISIEGYGYVRNWKWAKMNPGGVRRATLTFREAPAWDWDIAIPA